MAGKKTTNSKARKQRTSAKTSATRGGTGSRRKSGRQPATARRKRQSPGVNLRRRALVAGIILIFLTAVLLLSLLSPNQGQLTAFMSQLMWQMFGWGGVAIPILMGGTGFYLVLWGMGQSPGLPLYRLLAVLLLFLTFEAFASMIAVEVGNGLNDVWSVARAQTGGGYLGGLLVSLLTGALGNLGTILALLVAGLIATVMASGLTWTDLRYVLQSLLIRDSAQPEAREIPIRTSRPAPPMAAPSSRAIPVSERQEQRAARKAVRGPEPAAAGSHSAPVIPAPIFVSSRHGSQSWSLPPLAEMLEPGGDQEVNSATIREQVEIIEHTLDSFGAPATVVEISQGPTVTQYGVEPNFVEQRSGKRTKVKVGKIASLADDLALALAARSIRIQAPVPGKGYVGIEVPNTAKALVSLRDVLESAEFNRIKSPLRIGLGQNVAGQPIATDLVTMPHLLIAGTTGSGKSVCVNAIIACLLLQNTPEDLKLVMVDPKRVELTGYNGVPHLAAPVVVDLERVVGTLQWAMREMDNRYQRFADAGARNIVDYNTRAVARGEEKIPFIVFIIDELADLMMLSPEDTERGITRLAQLARATGIHMVIATQRPSVDVVTGLIKANFPARIAFAVASSTDSRVILDTTGAERLLGQGDMLFQSPDAAAPVRMQGCFVSDNELSRIIDFWQGARRFQLTAEKEDVAPAEPITQPPLWEDLRAVEEEAARHSDELLPEAIELVRKLNKASTSLLQRRFRIGYTRAARLIDIMEEEGVIGPPTGNSKAREVLAPTADGEETRGDKSDDQGG